VVTLLIEAGADVNAVDDRGMTPLMAATLYERDRQNLILLLEAGADVNAVFEDGSTALHSAATKTPANVFLLLAAGADGTIKTNDGDTPFDLIKDDEEMIGGAVYLVLQDASNK